MRFLKTGAETSGELLRFETVNPPTDVFEPMPIHPHQETQAKVTSGTLRFVADGEERRLLSGETITIPAGVAHQFVNDGDTGAVSIQEARPALCTAEFFETYFALAEQGELDEEGKPSMLRFVTLGPALPMRSAWKRGRNRDRRASSDFPGGRREAARGCARAPRDRRGPAAGSRAA